MTDPASARGGSSGARTLPDRLLGLVGGAMIVAALAVLLFGGEGDTGQPAAPAPRLSVVAPAAGALVREALVVEFRSDAELRPQPGGWGVGSHHLHLELDGTEYMPAPTDVERLPSGAYRWVLPRLDPGEHTLRLFWSGPDHRPLPDGASAPVRFSVANGEEG